MKREKLILLLVSLLVAALFLCCDRIGNLSDEKTEALYSELKADIQAGGLWELEQAYFHQEKDLPDNLSFLRSAAETVFENEDLISNTSGIWFSGEKYCKTLTLHCETPISEGEADFVIDELEIAKYYDRNSYKIWLYYHAADEDVKARYIEVVFQ